MINLAWNHNFLHSGHLLDAKKANEIAKDKKIFHCKYSEKKKQLKYTIFLIQFYLRSNACPMCSTHQYITVVNNILVDPKKIGDKDLQEYHHVWNWYSVLQDRLITFCEYELSVHQYSKRNEREIVNQIFCKAAILQILKNIQTKSIGQNLC